MHALNLSSRLALLALALASIGLSHLARAGTIFDGQYTASGGNYAQSRADWSSDLGADYLVGFGLNVAGQLQIGGNGTGSTSRPVNSFDSDFTIAWELDRKYGAAGNTFTGGQIIAPAAGSIEGRIFNYHLYSELGENSAGYGISTLTNIWQTHQLHLENAYQPVYFAMRYALTLSTSTGAYLNAVIQGPNSHGNYWGASHYHNLQEGWLGAGTHTFDGMVTGMLNTFVSPTYMYSYVGAELSLYDFAGQPGSGRADFDMQLTYSSSPITEFPGTPSSVPDALPMLSVIGLGMAGLVTLRHRCVGAKKSGIQK
jgi:hypothetical protein